MEIYLVDVSDNDTILFIVNNIKITFQSPIKLIQQQHPTKNSGPNLYSISY